MLARKQEVRQVGALPLLINEDSGFEVYLVTTRGSGRWIIPKGNLIPGLAPHKAAAQEALEEAGVVGVAEPHGIGTFEFSRRRDGSVAGGFVKPCIPDRAASISANAIRTSKAGLPATFHVASRRLRWWFALMMDEQVGNRSWVA